MPTPGVELTDIHRSLLAFAEGIAERPIELEATTPEPTNPELVSPELTNEANQWLWMSELAERDSIQLPTTVDASNDWATNRRTYRAHVLRQIGLTAFGAFDWFAAHPDLPTASAFGTPQRPPLLVATFDLCEEVRVDGILRRRFPGATTDLDHLRASAHALLGTDAPTTTTTAGDRLLHELRLLALTIHNDLATTPDSASPRTNRLEQLRAATATKHDSRALALAIFEGLTTTTAQAHETSGSESEHSDSEIAKAIEELLNGDVPPDANNDDAIDQHEAQQVLDDKSSNGDAEDPNADPDGAELDGAGFDTAAWPAGTIDADLETGHAQPLPDTASDTQPDPNNDDRPDGEGGEQDDSNKTKPSTPATSPPALPHTRSYTYDEWSYVHNTHLRNWCRVIEERLEGDNHHFIVEARQRNAALARKLEAQLALLQPRDVMRTHRVIDGDDLDLDAIIESIADRRAQQSGDDRLYVRKDRTRRDVAAAFLIDLSASTSSPINPPPPPEFEEDPDFILYPAVPLDDPRLGLPDEPSRTILDVSKESVALMCDALDRLGDHHAIYGFSGHGRHNAEFYVAKDFGQRTSPRTWSALSAMEPRRYTRMGPAIRHTAAKLNAQSARTKLLIMISDGYPQDVDYGEDRSDRDYGVHDTASALQDATNAGIDTFCITIDATGHDYLKRMCPDGRYLVIDDIESLPSALAQSYFQLSAHSS